MDNSNIVWRKSSRSAAEGHCIEVAMWRTSSHSTGNGGECVEVRAWRTSTHSTGNGGNCVEVAAGAAVVLARDSKDPDGPVLGFGAGAWAAFLNAVKSGRLDLA
ncbi:DUF397 domain-containing protein [Actinomadura geliboluensis]|jgi:hypothetical protein|uniref:DUF397 domain-containing protein n=1 Tax=Actinomadura geliboluensis TaxID=882440 RepID=A0A5S4H918_9ACTN|nr:DUF397 domain-containing protein [Actinomadura geliboluensis]TMR41466.1 DUF397 domain-containing protein [Actinomadura geliboluensis]